VVARVRYAWLNRIVARVPARGVDKNLGLPNHQEVEQCQRRENRRLAVFLREDDYLLDDAGEVIPQNPPLERLYLERLPILGWQVAAKALEVPKRVRLEALAPDGRRRFLKWDAFGLLPPLFFPGSWRRRYGVVSAFRGTPIPPVLEPLDVTRL
jgi:hypothetical protein